MANPTKSYQLQGAELLDVLENKGVRNEINRLILHPLGLEVDYAEGDLVMMTTNAPQGFLTDRIDNFKRQAFIRYSGERHQKRAEFCGFIIQTKPVYDSAKITKPIADPRTSRLGAIISMLEQVFHLCKRRLMENSKEKDENYWEKLDEAALIAGMYKSIEKGDFISLINFAAMTIGKDDLDKAIDKIKENHPPDIFIKEKKKNYEG
jgi:hypothetical protein